MHELRKDPILNRWVAVIKDSKPPGYYLETMPHPAHASKDNNCILCHGKEHETFEIFAIRDNNASNWRTRVIPRPYPVFRIEGDLCRRGVGMYDIMNSIGANEIIIESPSHDTQPEDMDASQMAAVLETYKHRLSELEKDPRFRYTLIHKDFGKIAGELYDHPHSQVVATPVIPKGIKEDLDGAKAYYYYKERCVFCDIINEELRTGKRAIVETSNFLSFTPFAPRYPFEYWIMPRRHNCAFQDISKPEIEDLAAILSLTIKKMRSLFKNPPYNYVLHTAPNRMPRKNHWHTLGEDFHWHIEIMPVLTQRSGFEIDSELYILDTSPEDAARYLREASPL
jgi:UDPglucose--hexose-1-phosphate uridylyltransferase